MESVTGGNNALKPDPQKAADVVVGVVTYRAGAYILDKFLANQKEIQRNHPSSLLVFATNEPDFAVELRKTLAEQAINGCVLHYETIRPPGAHSRVWNVACGREAIRRYVLKETAARYLLTVDTDMTYGAHVVDIMINKLQGYDVAYSGYALRDFSGIALAGGGCCILTREICKTLNFRCLEFKNGDVITEDTLFELDLMRLGKRMKKGFFVAINHYSDSLLSKSVSPHPVGLYRRITHSKAVRLTLTGASIILRRDVGGSLNAIVFKTLHPGR